MKLNISTPRKALNKAFLKVKPNRNDIETFKKNLTNLLNQINEAESEEFHKNIISKFLRDTYYEQDHYINTKGRNDLVIHNGKKSNSPVGVIVEAKKPTNKTGMPTEKNINVKALHELVLYYLRERITANNLEIKHLIATNAYEWFIFDARVFEKEFANNKELVKQFQDFEEGRLSDTKTEFFYNEIAKPAVKAIESEIAFTHINIRDYEKSLRNNNQKDDKKFIALYKIFSPEHLLKLPFTNDSNSLDKSFYSELLHIIGLAEIKKGSKKLIERKKEGERNSASLLENAIEKIDSSEKINRLKNQSKFGDTYDEKLFNVGLELVITWINRILFLKLLDAQLLSYHKGNKDYSFLTMGEVKNFDDLDNLFFSVLAKIPNDRKKDLKQRFNNVPYLNSSLFEPTELEHETLFIGNLVDEKTLPILSSTVLKNSNGKKRTGKLSTLEYLFEFLSSYDFSSEGSEDIQEDNKTLINASVLGLIFEKINGYKDGSFFTPGFITMYMCRETIRRAVLQKFKDAKGWDCKNIDDLYDKIENKQEANDIINSLKICDPAVGSGHFLVSALNEIIAIKSELKILLDRKGKTLRDYSIEVENDELIVIDDNGQLFQYNPNNKEKQRIQEALFQEKQTIIENCLFGVDINHNSVKICRLRLWIELLKNSYYKEPDFTELETLPNIDINIKCGNSLISRFPLDSDITKALKKAKWTIDSYKDAIMTYRNAQNKDEKRKMENLISNIKSEFRTSLYKYGKEYTILQKYTGKLKNLLDQTNLNLYKPTKAELQFKDKEQKKLEKKITKQRSEIEAIESNKIYDNAFEWRFEFPEVLNDDGEFVGFDIVIGNPPYIKEYEGKHLFDGLRDLEVYQGKMDIWYLFGSLALEVLKAKGLLSFIAQNNWITSAGAGKFRNRIISDSQIIALIDFGNYMVFDSASIQTMIMLFIKDKTLSEYNFSISRLKSKELSLNDTLEFLSNNTNTNAEYLNPTLKRDNQIDKLLTFSNNDAEIVLNKININRDNIFLTKNEVANGIHPHFDFVGTKQKRILGKKANIGDGIFGLSYKERERLKLSKKELSIVKPYYISSNFLKYYTNPVNTHWIIYTDSSFKKPEIIKEFPKIKKHLDKYKSVITSDNKPYGLHRAREERFFVGEKIVAVRKCIEPIFAYSGFPCYVSATFYIIKTDRINQKYLVGLLNSTITKFWLRHKGKMQGNNFQIDKYPILNIPIITPNNNSEKKIINLVDQILNAKKDDPNADTSALEKEIDLLVYQLYDLTDAEIEIIETQNY